MAVGTFVQPDADAQEGTDYKNYLEACFAVLRRLGAAGAAHEQTVPNMTVRLDADMVFKGGTLTEVAAQNTGTITAPVTYNRIDRVVQDQNTGAVSVVTGTEAGSPSPPAIPSGKKPNCQVLLTPSTTTITNQDITDERVTGGAAAEAFAVGDIHLSVNPTNPATTLGYGTWVAWGTGRMAIAVDTGQTEFNTVEKTGGGKTKNLQHSHELYTNVDSGVALNVDDLQVIQSGSFLPGSFKKVTTNGGSTAQDVLNPYITCYMWKRTA